MSASRADPCCSAEESNRKPTGSSEFLCACSMSAKAVLTAGAYFQRRTWRNGRSGPDTGAAARFTQRARAMSFFSRHTDHLLQMDWRSIAALALICAVAAFFIKDRLAHPPVAIFIYSLLLIFSILAQYVFAQAELFTPKKLDQC
jgi:hypothetical protein